MKIETVINPYFVFNGVDSRDMGIIITSMPSVVKPKRRVDTVQVAGRNGALHIDEGTYDEYTKTVACSIKKRAKIDEICQWLNGSGEVIFSTEPTKVYKANIINQISISQMMNIFQAFTITFSVFPFKYSVNAEDDFIEDAKEGTLFNKGTVYAEPVITIYGTGDVTLTVNGTDYAINNVDDFVTIDCELQEVYTGYENKNSTFMSAAFPRFEVGSNSISWDGDVSRVEIIPNWRWL